MKPNPKGWVFCWNDSGMSFVMHLLPEDTMIRISKSIAFILLVGLTACSNNVSFSVEVLTPAPVNQPATETPIAMLPSPTPWVEGTQTAQANQPPSLTGGTVNSALPTFSFSEVTQQVVEKPADFSPVLYGGNLYGNTFFLILGGVTQNGWLTPAESVGRFSGEVTYSLHNMTTASKYFLWGRVPNFSPTCQNYLVETDAQVDEGGFTGVIDGWSTTKREVTELSDDGVFYQEAVSDWLKTQGMTSPQPGTLQVFRTDLDGDGVNEIFISATHLDESQHMTYPGDYSVVLMRKVNENEAVTIPLVADVYTETNNGMTYPRTYSVANFIDLNQDGIMEVVLDIQKWEGFGASVYQINGQIVNQALSVVC